VFQHAEERAHRQAGSNRFAEVVGFAREDLCAVRFGAQDEIHVADGDAGARLNRGFADLGATDARVIRRAEVAHGDPARAPLELAVVTADGVVGQDEIVVSRLADAERVAHHRALAAGFATHDHQHQIVWRRVAQRSSPRG
jgi:hypothetical protein